PHRTEVAEHAAEELPFPGLAHVAGDEHSIARDDDRPIVVRIDSNLVERVGRLAAGDVDVRGLAPGPAAIVGAIQLVADDALRERTLPTTLTCRSAVRGGVLVLDERIQNGRVLLIEVETNAPDLADRETTAQPLPRVAAVVRSVDPAFGTALDD